MKGTTFPSSLYCGAVSHVELDWEHLEKCPALGPVKISIKQIGNKFAMALYKVGFLLLRLVMSPCRKASRKAGYLYNSLCSWKTRLEVPVHITAAMQTSLVEVFSFSCGIIPQVLLGSYCLCSCEPS